MDVLVKIETAKYLATEKDIETLARYKQEATLYGNRSAATYMKVLIALTAHQIGGKTALLSRRRGAAGKALPQAERTDHLMTLEEVNARCYGAVYRATVTPDIERKEDLPAMEQVRRSLERNRRTNYARSSMATVRAYVECGLDIRDVKLETVTKQELRDRIAVAAPPDPLEEGERLQKSAERAADRLVKEAEELAGTDPDKAEAMLNSLVSKLQEVIERIQAGAIPMYPEQSATDVIAGAVRGKR